MADITTSVPIAARRSRLPRLELPSFAIGASAAAISRTIGQAFFMAYVAPFQTTKRPTPEAQDDALVGRDPNW